jgi:23S rRNA (uracil1939-C5)-methyltransferase
VDHVVGQIREGSSVLDLYAGTGLFALSAAVARGARVTAVETDPVAAADLDANLAGVDGALRAVHDPVEVFTRVARVRPDLVIVDPPRTGMSREAMQGTLRLEPKRVIYVSCDVATLARDTRRLLDTGYAVASVHAFDLFPNTPHVETVAVFDGL